MSDKLNPKFPYKIQNAGRYLMFLLLEEILEPDEYDRAMVRLQVRLQKEDDHGEDG